MTSTLIPESAPSDLRIYGEPQLHTDGEILALAFAPDGTLWSVEDPGIVRQWNPSSGLPLEWRALSDLETLWAFSRDARVLASASDELTIWDPTSGDILTSIPQETWVTSIAYLPSDPVFVATGHDDGTVRYWDTAGHNLVHTFRGHRRAISALAVSGDGKILAAASEDKTISLWDIATSKPLGTLKGHTDRIPALVWHPNGKLLVSAGWDTTARIWDVQRLEPTMLLNTHAGQVTALAISENGNLLASADSDLVVHVWNLATRATVHKLQGPQAEIRYLAFGGDQSRLAANGDCLIHLWDLGSGNSVAGSGQRPLARTSLAVSPDGSRLASNSGGRGGRVWDDAGEVVMDLKDAGVLHDLRFSDDGKMIAAAAENHVRLWEAHSGKIVRDLQDFEEDATTIAFSADSSLLASGGRHGKEVWVWRMEDGEPVLLIPDAVDGCTIEALAFHPNGRLLAVGGIDHMATGGTSGAVCLWDLMERAEVAAFPDGATSIVFNPTGERLAIATVENTICLWHVEDKTVLAELSGHEGAVRCVAYSHDGAWLASGGDDRTIRIWDAEGEESACFSVDTQPCELAFSPDGRYLYGAGMNTTCFRLSLPRS